MNTRRLPFDKEGCPYGLERLSFEFYGLAKLSWLGNVSVNAKGCSKIPILEFFVNIVQKGGRGDGGVGFKPMFKKTAVFAGPYNCSRKGQNFLDNFKEKLQNCYFGASLTHVIIK